MDVGVVEAGEQKLSPGIDHFCVGTAPGVDFSIGSYGYDAVLQYGDCLGVGVGLVDRPDLGVGDDQVGCGFRLGLSTK